jgi:hypothetical protein
MKLICPPHHQFELDDELDDINGDFFELVYKVMWTTPMVRGAIIALAYGLAHGFAYKCWSSLAPQTE